MGKHYDKEFKVEAMRLAAEPGNTQAKIERDLGIGKGLSAGGSVSLNLMVSKLFRVRAVSNHKMRNFVASSVITSDFAGSAIF